MKKLQQMLAGILMMTSGSALAQFNIDWDAPFQHTTTSNFSNEARKVVVDEVNEVTYALYDVTSDLDMNGVPTANIFSYCIIMKYDVAGLPLGIAQIDVGNHATSGFDLKSGFGLELGSGGEVYVGYNSFNATSGFDVNISKYDDQLNLLWTHKFNALSDDSGFQLKVSDAGNAFAIIKSVAGTNIRHRIIKATGQATVTTAHYTYSAQPDFPVSLAVDASEKVYVTGHRLVGGVKNILVSCVTGASALGTLLWSKVDNCGSVGGDDFARQIIFGYDGFLYLTGSSQGPVSHGIDAVTMKFNPSNGKKIWQNFINLNLTDGAFFVLNNELNFTYVSWSAGNTVYVDQLLAADGQFVRRVAHNPVPVSAYNAIGSVTISDMKISNTKSIYLTGTIQATNGAQNFNAYYLIQVKFNGRFGAGVNASLPCAGSPSASNRSAAIAIDGIQDQVYMAYDQAMTHVTHAQETANLLSVDVTGSVRLAGNQSGNSSFSIGPNPFNSQLTINAASGIGQIIISDLAGREVYRSNGGFASEYIANLEFLRKGIYFVRVQIEGENERFEKITKQ